MSYFTPGPWQIEGKYQGDAGSLYLSTMHPMPIFELQPIVGTEAEHIANARLISAAPELLNTLKTLRDAFIGTSIEVQAEALKAARAVIAKAEGMQ